MKPKEQTFEQKDGYKANLAYWILAIKKIPFTNDRRLFYTFSTTESMVEQSEVFKKEKVSCDFETIMFDEQLKGTGTKSIFSVEITPVGGDDDFDGVWITFERNNEAYFEDMNYPEYVNYFLENGIEQGKRMTWQKAYDKICELARKEETLIPKLQ